MRIGKDRHGGVGEQKGGRKGWGKRNIGFRSGCKVSRERLMNPEKRGTKSTNYRINKGQKTASVTERVGERKQKICSERDVSELSLEYKVVSIQE